MSKKRLLNILILLCGLAIIAVQVFISKNLSFFTGTDDQAVNIIKDIAPNYKPWVSHIWEPQNEWMETFLFATQASLGLCVILFYILKQRNKSKISE